MLRRRAAAGSLAAWPGRSSSPAAASAGCTPPASSSGRCRRRRRASRSSTTSTSCSTRRCCPGAAAGTLEPRHVVVPLREELQRTDLRLGHGHRRRPGAQRARTSTRSRATTRTLDYDQLIVALGSVSRTLPIPGLAEHAIGFKTLADAIALRNQRAAHAGDRRVARGPERERAQYLTYVFVGAGYAGRRGPRRAAGLRRRRHRPLPALPRAGHALGARRGARAGDAGDLRRASPTSPMRELRGRGIEIRTEHDGRARSPTDSVDALRRRGRSRPAPSSGRRASSRTRSSAQLGLPLDAGGRIVVDRYMPGRGPRRTCGRSATPPPCPTRPQGPGACPPTAQHALRQGRRVGAQRRRRARRRPRRGRSPTGPSACSSTSGRHQAVAQTLGIRWRGFPAWFLARTYHLR